MRERATMHVGIVGVGTIAAAIVEAVASGPVADSVQFVLSPRSAGRAAALAARFPSVRIAATNQEVLDASDIVVLAVLPVQFEGVCAGLRFRADQVIASLIAGWPPSRLRPVVAPATAVSQLVPLPMIALHRGPVVMYPEHAVLRRLFTGCGELVVPGDETQLKALSVGSATMSTYFALQSAIADWITARGVEANVATAYVASLFDGMATETMHAGAHADLAAMVTEHETPGGLNEHVRTSLAADGAFLELQAQLSHLLRTRYASE